MHGWWQPGRRTLQPSRPRRARRRAQDQPPGAAGAPGHVIGTATGRLFPVGGHVVAGSPVGSAALDELVDIHDMRRRHAQDPERHPMHLGRRDLAEPDVGIVEGSRRIRDEGDAVAVEHGVARRRVTAVLGRHAGHRDGVDLLGAQDDVEVSAHEAAVAVLLEDRLVLGRRDLVIDVDAGLAVAPRTRAFVACCR